MGPPLQPIIDVGGLFFFFQKPRNKRAASVPFPHHSFLASAPSNRDSLWFRFSSTSEIRRATAKYDFFGSVGPPNCWFLGLFHRIGAYKRVCNSLIYSATNFGGRGPRSIKGGRAHSSEGVVRGPSFVPVSKRWDLYFRFARDLLAAAGSGRREGGRKGGMEGGMTYWQALILSSIFGWVMSSSLFGLTRRVRAMTQPWVTRRVLADTPSILRLQVNTVAVSDSRLLISGKKNWIFVATFVYG